MPSNFILQAALDQNNQSHFWPGPYPPTRSLIKLNNTIQHTMGAFLTSLPGSFHVAQSIDHHTHASGKRRNSDNALSGYVRNAIIVIFTMLILILYSYNCA